jgi:transcriptional regulator GlxA family with amidase domain
MPWCSGKLGGTLSRRLSQAAWRASPIQRHSPPSERDAKFDRLHGWIASHPHGNLNVSVLADNVGTSERGFVRHYGKRIGMTPARAIEKMRVEAARELLSTTSLPAKCVAQRCGFGSDQTMRRSFLRQIAVTPQDYRKRFCPAMAQLS